MHAPTDDIRIDSIGPLIPPAILIEEMPVDDAAAQTVATGRRACEAAITGKDDRLVVVVGPCSIHDVDAAHEYAERLVAEANRLADDLVIIMRVYFEKPRTTIGWKGLINDPNLDGSFQVNQGLRTARRLLRDLTTAGMPCGCEFLDTISPQFIADLVSWGAIGARTVESQIHRELASGLSMPVGFKNGTRGSLQIAVDALGAVEHPHRFLSVTKQGLSAIVATNGNPFCHLILRGSQRGPNFDASSIAEACNLLDAAKLPQRVMVDCSHGNSGKDPEQQPAVAANLAEQISGGNRSICGVMLESHLIGGRQNCTPGEPLTYGQSITDGCLSWDATVPVLETLAAAVRARRG